MTSLADRWTLLSTTRRVMLIAGVMLTVGLSLFAASISGGKAKALLFGGLDTNSMGEVVLRLDQLDALYEMRDAAIYVDADMRDGLRLALAARSLSMQGGTGFTVLDTGDLSREATERELARTLLTLPDIAEARVGLRLLPGGAVKASVGLTSASGSAVPAASAQTARQFVALATPGLPATAIPVFDGTQPMPLTMDSAEAVPSTAIGDDRAENLKTEIEALLGSLVGKDKLRVSVAVETNREASAREHRFLDPDSRVLRRSESTEIAETSAAGEDGEGSSEGRDETRSTDRYDYTETMETSTHAAGAVSRITVAVLIDVARQTAADGTVTETPRPRAEIAKIDALVKSAIGYDENRRDSVTIEQLSFSAQGADGAPLAAGAVPPLAAPVNMLQLVQLGVVAIVVLVLGLFVVRPVLMAGTATTALAAPEEEEEDDFFGDIGFGTASMGDLPDFGNSSAEMADLGGFGDDSGPDPRDRLREAITNQMDDSADVLKGWLEEETVAERRRAG